MNERSETEYPFSILSAGAREFPRHGDEVRGSLPSLTELAREHQIRVFGTENTFFGTRSQQETDRQDEAFSVAEQITEQSVRLAYLTHHLD